MDRSDESPFGTPQWCSFDAASSRVEDLLRAIGQKPPLIEVRTQGLDQKSAWLVETAKQLRDLGHCVACVDLTCLPITASAEEAFARIADRIARQLGSSLSVAPMEGSDRGGIVPVVPYRDHRPAVWDTHLIAIANFDRFMIELLSAGSDSHVVLFFDEVRCASHEVCRSWGSVLCGWIRGWRNAAESHPESPRRRATIVVML